MSKLASRRKFDGLEVALLVVLAAVVGWLTGPTVARQVPTEADFLREKYGPARHSEHAEEWIIREFFQDKRGGFFVDVGANHFRDFSNTYFLETSLGWSGIAVEPLTEFAPDYAEHRPRTLFRPFFVSDTSDERATMFVGENTLVSSVEQGFTKERSGDVRQVSVPTITLTDLLDKEGVTSVDFLSMDIELSEPKALAGFDIARFKPALVCIEAHHEVRQQILDYFARNGYVVVGRYLRADVANLYFRPLS